jgi:hypothetical protein
MKTKRNLAALGVASLLAATALLDGCLGDSSDNAVPAPVATSQVPGTASQSSAGFISYLQLLVVSSADTLEPVDTSMVTATADDTSEPVAVTGGQ